MGISLNMGFYSCNGCLDICDTFILLWSNSFEEFAFIRDEQHDESERNRYSDKGHIINQEAKPSQYLIVFVASTPGRRRHHDGESLYNVQGVP